MNENSSTSGPGRYSLVDASGFGRQTWLFRTFIVVLVYLTVALCSWLFKPDSAPLLDAIAPALGLLLGFGVLHVVDANRHYFR